MEFIGDFHIHTVASGDGFGTIKEILNAAKNRGFKIIAITDHGPRMAASSHYYYFESLIDNLPETEDGIKIYPGAEANIVDEDGGLDLPEKTIRRLKFLIASFHTFSWEDRGIEVNTKALKACLNRYNVKSIAHLNKPFYEIDIGEIIPLLLQKETAVEINNKALKNNENDWPRFKNIILRCRDAGVKFIVTSDAHYPDQVGSFESAIKFIEYCGILEEDILNTSWDRMIYYLGL